MPTVEATLQTTLGALCSGRCYPLVNNSATITYPYITFQVVSETTLTVTSDAKEAKRIQVDIFDRTYAGAKALAVSVKAAINSISGVASAFIVGFDGYEEATKDYRVIMEYYLWP
jgi:hypothetical protein